MAGPVLFQGNFVKFLKNAVKFFSGTAITVGSADPTSSAQSGAVGDVYISTHATARGIYTKTDAGSSTNWSRGGAVTKADVGLGNCDNTSDANKPVSTAQAAADAVVQAYSIQRANHTGTQAVGTITGLAAVATSGAKADVGLGNVDNTADTAKPVSTAQQTALNLKANLASPTFIGTVGGINSTMVGLGNVDNTSDATKNAAAVTLTNKTLTSPVVNTPTGIVKGDVGLGNVDNTSNATERAASATLTNKTLDNTNTVTLKGANLTIQEASDTTKQANIIVPAGQTTGTTRTITLPATSVTLCGLTSTQTLTNKDLTASTNTFPTGHVIQVVNTLFTTSTTGTTALPIDNTIPQNTEGDEYMTLAITPKTTTNKLKIEIIVCASHSSGSTIGVALFQDTTAGALAATAFTSSTANQVNSIPLVYFMAAGTTSSTTFKVRVGSNTGSTTQINKGGTSLFNGTCTSSITITEIVA